MDVGIPDDYTEVNAQVFRRVLDASDWERERYDVTVYRNKHNRIQFACETDDRRFFVSPAVVEWLKTGEA